MNYREQLNKIKNDYNRWLDFKESLENKLKSQKNASFRYDTRMEIQAVNECLVDLDTKRQYIYEHYILTINMIHGIAV
jgi:hypothetical protein